MNITILVTIILFVGFGILTVAPERAAKLKSLQGVSLKWFRLIGLMGLVWVGLSVLTDKSVAVNNVSADVARKLTVARIFLGGAISGFAFGLTARRSEAPQS